MRFFVSLLLVIFGGLLSNAAEEKFSSIASKIAPKEVSLGMPLEHLKAVRPAIFPGPSVEDPSTQVREIEHYATFMEVEGIGNPGHTSYWYLLSDAKVVGIIKTLSALGVDQDVHEKTARDMFFELAASLGLPDQRSVVRGDGVSFSLVRADAWEDSESGSEIFFIATNKEITLATLSRSSFPINQVFIKPDSERFPVISASTSSLVDFERPPESDTTTKWGSAQKSSSRESSSDISLALEPKQNVEVLKGRLDEETVSSDVGKRRSFLSSKGGVITLLTIGLILTIILKRRGR